MFYLTLVLLANMLAFYILDILGSALYFFLHHS